MNRIKTFFFGPHLEFRYRIFRLMLALGTMISLISIVEALVVGFDWQSIGTSLLLLCTMQLGIGLTFYFHKPEWAVFEVGCMLSFIFPLAFLANGGMESGASIWFVIGLIYYFIMYSGKKMVGFVIFSCLLDTLTYAFAYHFPQYVVRSGTMKTVYFDSMFSVISVGVIAGILMKYQIKQYEEEKRVAIVQKEELEKLEQSRNQFFTNISHEIRTPINTMIGFNELILRAEMTEDIAEYALGIEDAGKLLLSLVDDILDLAQMETKKMRLHPANYRTKDLFEELVEMIRSGVKEKGLDFYVDIDEKLPSVLFGDVKRIKQIILNLLLNAVKYTSSGSIVLSAHGGRIGEEWVKLTVVVSDTGTGIRKEDMAHLFESFRQTNDKENTAGEGAGLGLAICKHLLEMMGGEITVDSTFTKGADFTIIIEQRITDPSPVGMIHYVVSNRGMDRKRYKQSFEAPEARILIVDDNSMNLMVTSKLLIPTKVQIDTAKSGEECLKLTTKKAYQVILMDHMMPKMDGVETLHAIRTQQNGLCYDTPVLALTANAEQNSEEIYRNYGFQGYLCKPIRGEELEQRVLEFIPEELIEYRAELTEQRNMMHILEGENDKLPLPGRKRKKVAITTDCVCDLPKDLVASLDVKMMYLYITTRYARFRDTIEITSDNLNQYADQIGSELYADSASVEEFEGFFAQTLTEAEEVIHISLASRTGVSYRVACQAARGFGHVHVINSGQISGGEALLVLSAAKMEREGYDVSNICRRVEELSKRVKTSFLLPNASVIQRRGYWKSKFALLCDSMGLHPVLQVKNSEIKLTWLFPGKLEKAWKFWIQVLFSNKKRIDTEIIMITHVGLSVRQLEGIQKEIAKYVLFQAVRIERASVSNACNSGMKTVCISYICK